MLPWALVSVPPPPPAAVGFRGLLAIWLGGAASGRRPHIHPGHGIKKLTIPMLRKMERRAKARAEEERRRNAEAWATDAAATKAAALANQSVIDLRNAQAIAAARDRIARAAGIRAAREERDRKNRLAALLLLLE